MTLPPRRIFVLDTSYLLEIYRVPSCFEPDARAEILRRLGVEIKRRSRLYVPVAVVFEVANHIADVKVGDVRRDLAGRFADDIRTSLDRVSPTPWIVTPARDDEILRTAARLLDNIESFAREFAQQRVDLTDIAVMDEARRLRKEDRPGSWVVHIWTRDTRMKAHEPDVEADPFV